jgi:threonine dehydrogenase-like Zn-dependent dehydrogenase
MKRAMRAAVFKEGGKPWAMEERPIPTPGPGEALIKVGRCGICGTDINMTSGNGYDFPCDSVLGHEFAGEVVDLGAGVENLKVGDLVTALPATGCGECEVCRDGLQVICGKMQPYSSAYAEYMLIAARTAVKLPQSLSLADGALIEPLAVGLHGVKLSGLSAGARVLVLGAGSVGLAATYWARQLGAGRVVAASRSARREEKAMLLGAHAYVKIGEEDTPRIYEALGGMPDVVLETAGVVGMLGRSINLVRPNGHVVSLGFCMAPDPVIPGAATYRQARLTFSMAWTLDEFHQCVDRLDSGHVEPRHMISNTIALSAVPEKIQEMRGSHNETKVHVVPSK